MPAESAGCGTSSRPRAPAARTSSRRAFGEKLSAPAEAAGPWRTTRAPRAVSGSGPPAGQGASRTAPRGAPGAEGLS
ncbi:hypothetical protein FJ251_00920 [bacterium]|nr:hypothetical protein [bacterium]